VLRALPPITSMRPEEMPHQEVIAKPLDILLVEDNPADMRLAKEALKEGKVFCNLHWVKDGVEAVEFLNRTGEYTRAPRPDLILLDLNLPRMDGREVLASIKSDSQLKRIPVVILTTSKAEEDVARSYDLHANCYITKFPMNFETFVDVFRSIDRFWFALVTLPPKMTG
jgi:chemotaxis family two-component system response regulator Rcp1